MALQTDFSRRNPGLASPRGDGGPFSGIPQPSPRPATVSRDDLFREIERLGYTIKDGVRGQTVHSATGFAGRGSTTGIPLDTFIRDEFGKSQPSLLEQLTSALGEDITAQEAAVGRQRARIDDAGNLLRGAAVEGGQSITQNGDDLFDFLTTEARRRTDENLGRVEDLRAQTTSDATGQIFEQIDNAKREIMANPSLSEGERQARIRQLEEQGRRASQAALTQIANNYANLKVQTGVALSGQEAQTDQVAAQLSQAARLNAFNAKLAGANTYANFILQSPESVISRLAGLASIAQVATAPGGSSFGGLRLG